jgi:hypothetical protein
VFAFTSATARRRSPARDCKLPEPWLADANRPLLLLPVAASNNFGSGNCVHRPPEEQSNCRFFLQNVLILSPERPGTLLRCCFMSTSPHHVKRDEQGE